MPTPTTTLATLQLVTPVLPTGTSVLSIDSSVLPFIINADQNTTRIEISIYNTMYGDDTFTTITGSLPHQFSTSIPLIQTTQETNVSIIGRNYDPTFSWEPNTVYALGQHYGDPNGNVQVVVGIPVPAVNTSGAVQPTWSTFPPITATSVTVSNNVLTVVVPNSFTVGQNVYLTGFQNATFLNGQVVTVSTPGVTQFSAPFSGSNYGPASDTGTCQAVTVDNGLLWANIGGIAVTPITRFSLLFVQSGLAVQIAPPSGISALKDQTDCTLQWVTPDYPGFIGVRVQISTDPAGINPPFMQYGDLITDITSSTETLITSSTATSVNVPTATITSVVLANNLLTVLGNNTFVPGTVAAITGLTYATFLNDENVTVLDATPTSFTASFTAENYGNAITATRFSAGVLTVIVPNNYSAGQPVTLSGTDESFLNGSTVTVLTASPSQFTASFVYQSSFTNLDDGGVASIADLGTATSVISTSTTTNTNVSMTTNYSTVDVPSSIINQQVFYAVFSTVIQDPTTNIMYESIENGPLLAGFVNLKLAAPTDFPVLQRKEDIAGRLIAQINKQLPNLDLSPHSEIRDIFIDPFSIEVANMSIREWFARVSESISAISQVDNANGNGVSDPFQSSPYKQQIARAYGLSPQNTQNLINEQFDLLGEAAGLTRLGSTQSTVVLTFYTYQKPQSSITIPEGATVSTQPDASTTQLTFVTQGQGIIDITNLNSFYNSQTGWWGVSVPAQCTQPGSVGNVGAGTIQQTTTQVPTGINVTNLVGANFGQDQESNSAFAARIQARNPTGIDSSSANGYLVAALSTPGIIAAQVVAAGDLYMLRDWDPTRQKHVFGCVDIYVQGTTLSQNDEYVPFVYADNGTYGIYNSYSSLSYLGGTTFQISGFNALAYLPYDGVELYVSRASGSFYLSLDRAQFNDLAGTIILNPNDIAYQYAGSTTTQAKVALVINGNPATNQAALAALSGASSGTYSFQLFFREASPFTWVPSLQPVIQVYSVTGEPVPGGTGSIPSSDIALIHTSDFLLYGGSNDAGDTVQVALVSSPVTNLVPIGNLLTVPTIIDYGMDQVISSTGVPGNVLSVLSTNLQTSYQYGIDYTIVPTGPYLEYGIQPLTSSVSLTQLQVASNILTVTAPNEFGVGALITFSGIADATLGPVLNGTTVTIGTASSTQFTATLVQPNYGPVTTTGLATGSAIQPNQTVSITYNKYVLYEHLSYVYQESQVLSGTLPTTLDNDGFVENTWLPQSYTTGIPTAPPPVPTQPGTYLVTPGAVGNQLGDSLILDGWDSAFGSDGGLDIAGSLAYMSSGLVGNGVPYASRYIKVTYFNGTANVLMKQNIDYILTVNPTSGSATIARLVTGRIPDGATVLVSYFITETFTVSTQYPTFVEQLANAIAITKSAAASVLIKAEVANDVDITMTVTLEANTSPETVDPTIRTVINIVLDNSQTTLYQSELISQVQAITGVQSVEIPLIKCAKSDGSYDIGVVVPDGTVWIPLSQDPAFAGVATPPNSWITANSVLPDSTIPSGGEPTAIVDFLYQGQAFQRATSIQNFLQTAVEVPHLAVAPGVVYDTPGSFYIIGINDAIISATITATSITNSVVTVNFTGGSFAVGQLVQLVGTAESFLNGQNVTITSVTGNQFTANFMEGNYSNLNDTGSIILPASYAEKVIVTIPADVPNPGNLPYFVTYQVFDENGASDITVSPTEYLAPGTITINYVTPTGS
jgi:Baseplate J-like protein